ncbi:MAG TPA: porin [Moraxellaceae bacterium]
MKRTLIALGVAATVALPVAAQAAPKVYGKLNLSVQNVDPDYVTPAPATASDVWEVRSNASRFGVKGEDELTATLSAIYQIEWEVSGSGSGDSAADLAARNRYVGIKHNDFGNIKLGKIDTYVKQAEGKIDQFNDLPGDIDKVIGAQAGPARPNNVIDYTSPKIVDAVTIGVQLIQGENTVAVGSSAADPDTGLADAISTSVVYNDDTLYLALGYDKDVPTRFAAFNSGNGFKANTIRAAGSYSLKDLGLSLGAIYQTSKSSDLATGPETKEDGWIVSAAFKFAEAWVAKAQYGQSTNEAPRGVSPAAGQTAASATQSAAVNTGGDVDLSAASLGLDYNFTSKTRAFGFYTLANRSNNTQDLDTTSYGIGIDHSF